MSDGQGLAQMRPSAIEISTLHRKLAEAVQSLGETTSFSKTTPQLDTLLVVGLSCRQFAEGVEYATKALSRKRSLDDVVLPALDLQRLLEDPPGCSEVAFLECNNTMDCEGPGQPGIITEVATDRFGFREVAQGVIVARLPMGDIGQVGESHGRAALITELTS
jgi:hypothetical protein